MNKIWRRPHGLSTLHDNGIVEKVASIWLLRYQQRGHSDIPFWRFYPFFCISLGYYGYFFNFTMKGTPEKTKVAHTFVNCYWPGSSHPTHRKTSMPYLIFLRHFLDQLKPYLRKRKMYRKGLFTWTKKDPSIQEDPRRRNNISFGSHAEIPVRVVPKCRKI